MNSDATLVGLIGLLYCGLLIVAVVVISFVDDYLERRR